MSAPHGGFPRAEARKIGEPAPGGDSLCTIAKVIAFILVPLVILSNLLS